MAVHEMGITSCTRVRSAKGCLGRGSGAVRARPAGLKTLRQSPCAWRSWTVWGTLQSRCRQCKGGRLLARPSIKTDHQDRSPRPIIKTDHQDRSPRPIIKTDHQDRSPRPIIRTDYQDFGGWDFPGAVVSGKRVMKEGDERG